MKRAAPGPRPAKLSRSPGRPRYVYVSYHKCATQFTARVLRAVCDHHGLRVGTFDSRHDKIRRRAARRVDFLMITDFSSGMLDLDAFETRGVYVIRDPRDILVSMYFSHRSSHPLNHDEIVRDRAALADLDVQEGLEHLLNQSGFFRRITRELDAWNPEPGRFHETTFARLTADPRAEFQAMLDHLGLVTAPREIERILEEHSFAALQSRWAAANPDADENHYRSGAVGQWRTHLVGPCRDMFRERYGPLLIKLGFETDLDW